MLIIKMLNQKKVIENLRKLLPYLDAVVRNLEITLNNVNLKTNNKQNFTILFTSDLLL